MGPVVILLKSPSEDEDRPDEYIQAFEEEEFRPRYVPVLETEFVQVEELKYIIQMGPEDAYSGVVITSRRGAETWQKAADAINDGGVVIGMCVSRPDSSTSLTSRVRGMDGHPILCCWS